MIRICLQLLKEITQNSRVFSLVIITVLLFSIISSCSDSSNDNKDEQHTGWAISPNSTNGYASIIYTSNSGKTWVRQGNPFIFADIEIADVSAMNSKTAFVAGFNTNTNEGVIFRTTDAGKNWQKLTLPQIVNKNNFLCIRTNFNQKIIAGGNSGMLIMSTDKGNSWQEINIPVPDSSYGVYRVDFDANQRIVAGASNSSTGFNMYYSYDNGASWPISNSKPDEWDGLIDVSWVQGTDIVYAAGAYIGINGIFNVSRDAGKNWTMIDTFPMSHCNAIFAFDSNYIWAGADKMNFARTTNAGNTWEKQSLNYNAIWTLGISAISKNELWVVGCNGDGGYTQVSTILHSIDSGASWEQQTVPDNIPALWRVSFPQIK
ncbi:MAG TPA: hypothetical protein PK762_10250 [Candidatus Kapabacteria bacterium]|nr:hypothetical protein [Candidatus Kapabacteria bacterium]